MGVPAAVLCAVNLRMRFRSKKITLLLAAEVLLYLVITISILGIFKYVV